MDGQPPAARGGPGAIAALLIGAAGLALFASVSTWWWRAPDDAWSLAVILMLVAIPLGLASAIYSVVRGRLSGPPLAAALGAIVIAAVLVAWIVYVFQHIGPNF
jgi:hypothetical protein